MVGGVRPESLRSPLLFSFPDGAAMGQPAATPWLSMMAPGTLSSQSAVGLGFPSSNPGDSTLAVTARVGLVGAEHSSLPQPTSHLQ